VKIAWKFPHLSIAGQILAPQPALWLLALSFFVVCWMLSLLTWGLMRIGIFIDFATRYPVLYSSAFYSLQTALVFYFTIIFFRRHDGSLRTPMKRSWKYALVSFCILLPVSILDWQPMVKVADIFTQLNESHDPALIRATIIQLYHVMWDPLVTHQSIITVICTSAMSFLVPVYEELLFTGFVANRFARKFGTIAAIFLTPLCFTLAHVPRFGLDWGIHSLPVFAMGLTCVIIRFWTGSVVPAIISHLLLNLVIFFPKWMVAYIYWSWRSHH